MIGAWLFKKLDEETLRRVCVMSCRRCDGSINVGELYGLKIVEHIPRWKFWRKNARVDSYHFRCAINEIQSSMLERETPDQYFKGEVLRLESFPRPLSSEEIAEKYMKERKEIMEAEE